MKLSKKIICLKNQLTESDETIKNLKDKLQELNLKYIYVTFDLEATIREIDQRPRR